MEQGHIESIKATRSKIRLQTIAQVLDEFDGSVMELDLHKRNLKYLKMAQSPFSFYRGSSYLFYYDVSRVWFPFHSSPERPTWIQGDLHFENFGAYRNESGFDVFDINDFDEGYVGSYLYDLLRMCVSILLVYRSKELALGKELELSKQKEALFEYITAYVEQIEQFAKRKEDPRSLVFDEDQTQGPIRKLLKKLKKRDAGHLLLSITELAEGSRRFTRTDEMQEPTEAEAAMVRANWPSYLGTLELRTKQPESYYTIKDIVFKHGSGTASIGLNRFYVLIEGKSNQELDDIVVELKEVRGPVPAYFMPYNERFWQQCAHQGQRVTLTQKAMHHEADPLLGYLTMADRHYYVRERSPFKKKLKVDNIADRGDWLNVLQGMGQITAKIHARADVDMQLGMVSHHSEDEIKLAMGEDTEAFKDYIANWALAYVEQVEEDYELFMEWIGQG
ncbi:DUF2252 domain-containing protein [Paenibacillus agricola]|uniref:DUF2252 family protein n=1 Tax=Paenibacillus agricola TaxID=2716264 RepID=A0ABX0J931_9BACL|nr:DUF2252 family protein [Paenibacillus agricola]NHN31699.1 DUF2252 family protein [Paenibacillus agricola]